MVATQNEYGVSAVVTETSLSLEHPVVVMQNDICFLVLSVEYPSRKCINPRDQCFQLIPPIYNLISHLIE